MKTKAAENGEPITIQASSAAYYNSVHPRRSNFALKLTTKRLQARIQTFSHSQTDALPSYEALDFYAT